MIKKISAIGFFVLLFALITAGCIIIAARVIISLPATKNFVTGAIAPLLPSGNLFEIGDIKLLIFPPETGAISFNKIKIYGTTLSLIAKVSSPVKKTSATLRQNIFSSDKIIIQPDYSALLRGDSPKDNIKKIEITNGAINLIPYSDKTKLRIENMSATISDIPRGWLRSMFFIKKINEPPATFLSAPKIKSGFTLKYLNNSGVDFESDVALEDGYIDFPSGILTINKLSCFIKKNAGEIYDIKGVVKFHPEGITGNLSFEVSGNFLLEKIIQPASDASKIFGMIRFGDSAKPGGDKFRITISKRETSQNSPTEITITHLNSKTKIILVF